MLDQPIVWRVFLLTYLGWTLIHFFAQIGTPRGCELYIDPDTKEGLDLTWSLEDARSTCMSSNLSVRKGDPQHRWRWSFREGHYRQACKPQ